LNNCPFILIPDNNVCIHISELTSKLNKDELKKLKASALLKYLYESQITIVSAFGLIERALKPRTLKINLDKLNDFDLIFQECIGATGRLSSSIIEDFEIFKYILYPNYAYLLAIKIIEMRQSINRENFCTNLSDFCELTKRFQFNSVLPFQFAVSLFGGDTKIKKLITTKKKGSILQTLWGAAWDLSYIGYTHSYDGKRQLSYKANEDSKLFSPQLIFVTDDEACSLIAELSTVDSYIYTENDIHNLSLVNYEQTPYLKDSNKHVSFLKAKMSEINIDSCLRIGTNTTEKKDVSEEVKSLLERLEAFIPKMEQEIEILEKANQKGFG
jgi:hypothetical protein